MATGAKKSLDGLFKGEGIAIIGASSKKGKPGNQIVEFAKEMDFAGTIYPINPTADSISGLKCYKTLGEIPGRVDIVVSVLHADETIEAAHQIARRHDEKGDVAVVVVVSGGFSERGDEIGKNREAALLEPLLSRGIRVVGPNCQGIIDTYQGINTTFDVGNYRKGGVCHHYPKRGFRRFFFNVGSSIVHFGAEQVRVLGEYDRCQCHRSHELFCGG